MIEIKASQNTSPDQDPGFLKFRVRKKTPRSGRIRIRNPVKICSTQGASQGVILLGEGGSGLAGWVKSQSGRFVTPHQNVKGWRGRVIFNKLRLGKKFGFAPHRPKKKMNI